jgi:hypothetical protein
VILSSCNDEDFKIVRKGFHLPQFYLTKLAIFPSYSGTDCEHNIDECAESPCLNEATCVDGINNYTCACQPGYTGRNCQVKTSLQKEAAGFLTARNRMGKKMLALVKSRVVDPDPHGSAFD